MAKVLIRRSDGRVQLYNVGKGWKSKHQSSVESVRYHGKIRKRVIYGLLEVGKEREAKKWMGHFYKEERVLKNKKEYVVNSPVFGLTGQVRVKIKAYKGEHTQTAEGCSYKDDISHSTEMREKMTREALAAAYAQITFSPEGIQVLNIDFKYFVDKNE